MYIYIEYIYIYVCMYIYIYTLTIVNGLVLRTYRRASERAQGSGFLNQVLQTAPPPPQTHTKPKPLPD